MEVVTGDAPQPGETPREESNPWTFSDPDTAFWRGDDERDADRTGHATDQSRRGSGPARLQATVEKPTFRGEQKHIGAAADAHAAGREDVAEQLVRGGKKPAGIEHAHERLDSRRFNPLSAYGPTTPTSSEPRPPEHQPARPAASTGPQVTDQAQRSSDPQRAPDPAGRRTRPLELPTSQQARLQLSSGPRTPIELPAAASTPVDEEAAPTRKRQPPDKKRPPERKPAFQRKQPRQVPEPEAGAAQPTIGADRPVPPQASTQSRLAQAAQRPPSPLLETSPFWLSEEERAARAASWPEAETREKLTAAGAARRKQRQTHRPAYGLLGLIGLGLVAAFFAWVSAEPFWLAAGHGHNGLATVTQCTGDGVSQRCTGTFQATGDVYSRASVTLLGVEAGQRNPGAVSPARMVNPHSRQAYVGEAGVLVQLRWVLGFVLVLACGIGIAALTGSRQLENVRARRRALAMSLAGPLFLLLGFLLVAY